MNNNQLLQQFIQAVSDILDTKLESVLQPIKADIQEMKADIQEMKADIQEMKADIEALERRLTALELHVENETDKSIRILAENHLNLSDKLNEAIPAVDKQCVYEVKVNYLVRTVDKLKIDVAELQEKMA